MLAAAAWFQVMPHQGAPASPALVPRSADAHVSTHFILSRRVDSLYDLILCAGLTFLILCAGLTLCLRFERRLA